MKINSKLPEIGTNIFSTMSALATKHQAINLAQGFPDFDTPAELRALLNKYVEQGRNQYAPMCGIAQLRSAIAKKVNTAYNCNLDIDQEICITAGASQAIFNAIISLVPRHTEVIIIEPCYDSYVPAILLAGATPVSYVMQGPDFQVNWEELGSLINDKTSMIIVNTPHNPTGTIFRQKDLEGLHHITKNTNVLILSDEVYEHLVYDSNQHHSLLSHPGLFQRTIAVFSFGKTFHCTGWKIGYAIAPEPLMSEYVKCHQFDVFCVSHFSQYALAEYLQNADHYNQLGSFYQEKRDHFQNAMAGSSFRPLATTGSFFQLYDYAEISDMNDGAFAQKLTIDHGVAAIPISSFYTSVPEKQYVRFCFAKKLDTLDQATSRLQKVNHQNF